MSLRNGHRPAPRPVVRAAAALFAAGGLAASVLADAPAGAASGSRGKNVVISTTRNATYGTILVSGRTVYTLKASKTSCGTKCRKVWPEVLLPKGVKKAKAGTGVVATKLGTVKRKGGALQVTYNGKALYWFSLDRGPGQVNGSIEDRWGVWSVVVLAKPAAVQPVGTTTTSPTSTTVGHPATGGTSHPTLPPAGTTPTAGTTPITTPTTAPPPPTTTVPPTTTTTPPTTTTTSPGGGGVGF